MKRLLLVFLFLLPLQATWAAMGAYAHHGEGEESHHSALHKHQHTDKHSSDTSSDKLHHHCGISHAGGAALSGFFQLTFSSPVGSLVSPYHLKRLPAPVTQRPERPNWISAAI
jgi:hypothetical protein